MLTAFILHGRGAGAARIPAPATLPERTRKMQRDIDLRLPHNAFLFGKVDCLLRAAATPI